MNIDFIKWMVGYADGFEMYDDGILLPNKTMTPQNLECSDTESLLYPLLLQRAIEGFNKEHDILHFIEQYCDYIGCAYDDKEPHLYYFNDMKPDQAKEKALMYVYEQEAKN